MVWSCAGCCASSIDDTASRCVSCGRTRSVDDAAPAAAAVSAGSIDDVPEVIVDPSGVFKYIQIRVSGADFGDRLLVRGHQRCKYHDDVFQIYRKSLLRLPGVTSVECVGGGRIDLREGVGARVYGHSVGYGLCDHALTAAALRRAFPALRETVTWDNTGY